MIWLAFARKYAWVLAVAALVAIVLYSISAALNRAEQTGYERATAEMTERVSKANAETAALEQRQRAQSARAAQAWETQRDELQSQVDRLLTITRPSVRLCKPAREVPVPSAADSAGRIDDGAERSIDAVQVGPDIGSAAVLLAGECERYRRQLSALQAWVKTAASYPHPAP